MFSKNNASRDGLQAICKKCDNFKKKEWYQENKEREVAKRKKWIEENREHHNEIAYAYLVRTGRIKNPRRPVTIVSKKEQKNAQ